MHRIVRKIVHMYMKKISRDMVPHKLSVSQEEMCETYSIFNIYNIIVIIFEKPIKDSSPAYNNHRQQQERYYQIIR